MTKIALTAVAFVALAGAASASLYAGFPVDVDVNTLTDVQRATLDNIVASSDSARDIINAINGFVN